MNDNVIRLEPVTTEAAVEQTVKIKEWKFVTLEEKSNLPFLEQLKKAYESNKENYQTNVDYIKIADAVTRLRKTKEKELERLEKEEENARKIAEARARRETRHEEIASTIDEKNLYFVATANKYYYYDKNRNIWDALSSEATYKLFKVASRDDKQVFDITLAERGHTKLRVVNTFKPHTEHELNLLDRSKWLHPKSLEDGEKVDEWIDTLVWSVAGESQGAKDHLEQVIAWKYCHPEDYKIPAQSPYGKGGAGKNKFVEMVLATIFGREQIAVIGTDEAFGNFNGQMIGKTIVFIDEAVSEKSNSEALKRKVMNETININVKHGVQGTFDSTALFFISGNCNNGAIKLAGDVTDRRFSLYRNNRSLYEIVSERFGCYWNAEDEQDPRNKETENAYADNEWRFADKDLVAKWLGHIIEKWIPQLKTSPRAYHDKEYNELVDVNKPEWQSCLETVFNPDEPEMENVKFITGRDLYRVYELMSKFPLKNRRFYNEARYWLKANYPEWEWDVVTVVRMVNGAKKRTTADAFVRGIDRTFAENTDLFIVFNEERKREEVAFWLNK